MYSYIPDVFSFVRLLYQKFCLGFLRSVGFRVKTSVNFHAPFPGLIVRKIVQRTGTAVRYISTTYRYVVFFTRGNITILTAFTCGRQGIRASRSNYCETLKIYRFVVDSVTTRTCVVKDTNLR